MEIAHQPGRIIKALLSHWRHKNMPIKIM